MSAGDKAVSTSATSNTDSNLAKEAARKSIQILVDQFTEHLETYKSPDYNEATLRIDFLNKFFKALGWDVENDNSLPPSYREVVTEDSVQVEGRAKSPDYSFRQRNMQRAFFVEAKKPHVNISKHADSAFQLRRYGWSAGLTVSILTSFEYLAIYDCTLKPVETEKASYGRLKLIPYTDLLAEFDFIWDAFSKPAVDAGSLNQFKKPKKSNRGSDSVDRDFLESLDNWRIALAKDIHKNNSFDEDQLNFTVQQTIDRVIFLRIAEDRNVEEYGTLREAVSKKEKLGSLKSVFRRADGKYNSGLFAVDQLTYTAKISDTVIEDFISGLYYPQSPYEFSVLPLEILGKAYEQFLGKQIKIRDNGAIKIEDKPEVRKAGGVYYTPRYIVDWMVSHTLGAFCDRKNPDEIASLKVLDPASGSGSFLLSAYDFLLDWHKDYFNKHKGALTKKKLKEVLTPSGDLTTSFKGKILINNIFGVDIDPNAVEVTKLSLLLKCMEGESKESMQAQLQLFHERVLPTLDDNIKCGNSLIDYDLYAMFPDIGEDIKLKRKINAFNWRLAFKSIFDSGKFDVIIGNPPYIFTREHFNETEKTYYDEKYGASWEKKNTFLLFMERILSLGKPTSLSSFIVPNSWLTVESARLIREKYIPLLTQLIDLNYLVFEDASMEPTIFVIGGTPQPNENVSTAKVQSAEEFGQITFTGKARREWIADAGRITVPSQHSSSDVLNAIWSRSVPLKDRFQIFTGLQAYEKGKGTPKQSAADVKNRIYDFSNAVDKSTFQYLNGVDIERFSFTWSETFLKWGPWLSQPRNLEMFTRPRVLVREITGKYPKSIFAAFFDVRYLNNKSVINILHETDSALDLVVLEAILNSKLMSYFYKNRGVKSSRKVFPKIVIRNMREFPFPISIDRESKETLQQDVSLIRGQIERLKSGSNTPQQLAAINRELTYLEDKINRLVYQIYGLGEDHILVIEQGAF